ncbi:hypothetical protein AAG570_004798 [Ranatra chinensis]|uniref:Uncharacterized protein n=1 Tax=Ranatra chinensis TaxID=642074 RepID=A0ABD0Y281_9HEMI
MSASCVRVDVVCRDAVSRFRLTQNGLLLKFYVKCRFMRNDCNNAENVSRKHGKYGWKPASPLEIMLTLLKLNVIALVEEVLWMPCGGMMMCAGGLRLRKKKQRCTVDSGAGSCYTRCLPAPQPTLNIDHLHLRHHRTNHPGMQESPGSRKSVDPNLLSY